MKTIHIQTEINEDDFLRLKALCILQRKSLKSTMRDVILHYLNNQQLIFNEGEHDNGS